MELTNKAATFDSLIKLNLKFVIYRDGKTLNWKQFFIDYSPLFDHGREEPAIIAPGHDMERMFEFPFLFWTVWRHFWWSKEV